MAFSRSLRRFFPHFSLVVSVLSFIALLSCATVQKAHADIKSDVSAAFDDMDEDSDTKQARPSEATTEKKASSEDPEWDLASLDTARNAPYLNDVEKDVILEMNKVRSDPKKYAELYIKPQLKYYSGNRYSVQDARRSSRGRGQGG